MSSHREAPEISKDPVADSTDVYAFVSPDDPTTATLIANYVPLQAPAGGPNFYEFGDDVLYEINIANSGRSVADISYQFQFTSKLTNPNTFLYNTGTLTTNDLSAWNRRQYVTITRVAGGHSQRLANMLPLPPCNVGPLSTPDYAAAPATTGGPDPFTSSFIHKLSTGETVFAGQRAEGFYVDLGAIFDLGNIRTIAQAHLGMLQNMPGVNTTSPVNVHTIAIKVPIKMLTAGGVTPTDASKANSTIGVWTTASRQRVSFRANGGYELTSGGYVQVSRMGNPLFNEVLVPISQKDYWNSTPVNADSYFAKYVDNPELGQLLPVLFPGAFPNLAAYNNLIRAGKKTRADLDAILLTGIPTGVIKGFQNYTGSVKADVLRLNLAVPPTATSSSSFSNLGLVGGDAAGFPNGRRVYDDVTTIELKAVAGATIPLVDPSFTPDKAVGIVDEYLTSSTTDITAKGSVKYLTSFPYLGTPHNGYYTPATTPTATPPAPVPTN